MPEERTASGNVIERGFELEGGPLYALLQREGYEIFYYGADYHWGMINIHKRKIWTYTEGDVAIITAADLAHLRDEVKHHVEWFKEHEERRVPESEAMLRKIEAEIERVKASPQENDTAMILMGRVLTTNELKEMGYNYYPWIKYVVRTPSQPGERMNLSFHATYEDALDHAKKIRLEQPNWTLMIYRVGDDKHFSVGDIVETPKGPARVVGSDQRLVTVFSEDFGEALFKVDQVRKVE